MSSALMLAGCSSDHFTDLEDYVVNLKKTIVSKAKQKTLPPIHLPAAATYQAESQRAPFAQAAVISEEKAAINPLMAYPLNMLRFVGTMTVNNVTEAYIITPDNMVYQVKVGDTLGDHNGKVVSILPDRINIMEQGTEDETTNMKQKQQHIETLQLKDEH